LQIGAQNDQGAADFAAYPAVLLFDRALTASQIQRATEDVKRVTQLGGAI
jgi:hypothetical protein